VGETSGHLENIGFGQTPVHRQIMKLLNRTLIQSAAIFAFHSWLFLSPRAFAEVERCPSAQSEWTQPERLAWQSICLTGHANLQHAPITAEFIRALLTVPEYSGITKGPGIQLMAAKIESDLDLTGIVFDGDISLTESTISGTVKLTDGKFGTLSFIGSDLLGGITANRAIISGSLLLGKLDRSEPNHQPVTSENSVKIGEVVGSAINIKGTFNIFSASLTRCINLGSANIDGNFNLMNVIGYQVLLYASVVNGQANIVDSHLQMGTCELVDPKLVDYFDSKFTKSIFFNRSEFRGDIDLISTEVFHDVNLLG
jgi:hypothetical protein